MPSLTSPTFRCRPPLWARGGHAQTILGHLLPVRAPEIGSGKDGFEALDVDLPDGDRLRVLFADAPHGGTPPTDTVVYFFHGLSGDANSDYMRRGVQVARALGHAVIAANHRGCGEGRGLAAGPYHSGRSDDVGAVIAHGRRLLPEKRHVAVGFSLSGNALLLLLARGGETRGQTRRESQGGVLPDASIAIHPPIDLKSCAHAISRGFNRVYDVRFVNRLRTVLAQRVRDGLLEESPRVPRLATLNQFDELYTAPAGGFADADDYYARCSTRDLLHAVDVPTAVLIARDDPFVDWRSFQRARPSPHVHVHLEDHGGHMGYVAAGPVDAPGRGWLDGALAHYLRQLAPA